MAVSRGEGVSALGGCLLLGGVCSWGVSAPGGGLLWGVVCSGGVWYPSMHWGRQPPMWTDTCLYKHNLRNFVADGNETDCNHVDSGLDAKESAFRFFNDIDKLSIETYILSLWPQKIYLIIIQPHQLGSLGRVDAWGIMVAIELFKNLSFLFLKTHMSHFSCLHKMRYPHNLVLENWEYLWFYWTFWIVIIDCGLKLHKLLIHTLLMLQKGPEIH